MRLWSRACHLCNVPHTVAGGIQQSVADQAPRGAVVINTLNKLTRSSATTDRPRDVMCQSKSCQLLHNSVGTTCTTSPEQIEVMGLESYSRPTYSN